MPDQEVHEIQLNGKQLVFMFMAATAVAVVVFFCGVMVGRGVRQPQTEAIAASTDPSIDPTAPIDAGDSATLAQAAPAPERENLTYAERLEAPKPLNEPLKFTESKPVVAPPVVEQPVPSKAVTPPEPKERPVPRNPVTPPVPAPRKTDAVVASSNFAEPPAKDVVYQVQAHPTRSAAEAQAARLKGKGYAAFVTENPAKVGLKYRVRVGATKREADGVLRRLKKEEHVTPWLIP
jgi:cell division septation protein DedD